MPMGSCCAKHLDPLLDLGLECFRNSGDRRRIVLLGDAVGVDVTFPSAIDEHAIEARADAVPTVEQDWSVAMAGRSALLRVAAAGFSLLAYLYQALALVMLFAFVGATLLMARTIGRHGSGRAEPPLLVDIGSNDPQTRVGFEKFVLMIDYMILFVFLAYTNFA